MALYAKLRADPMATPHELEESMDGNLCRCTGYRPIIDAVRSLSNNKVGFDPSSLHLKNDTGGGGGGGCCQGNGGGGRAPGGVLARMQRMAPASDTASPRATTQPRLANWNPRDTSIVGEVLIVDYCPGGLLFSPEGYRAALL